MPASVRKKGVKKKRGSPSENEIHMKCWQWVQKEHPSLLIFHVANELKAAVQYHLKLKRLGKLPGVADFLAFPVSGQKYAIEMKDDKGKQDADQIKFQKRWQETGGTYYVCRTVDDFKSVVGAIMLWG